MDEKERLLQKELLRRAIEGRVINTLDGDLFNLEEAQEELMRSVANSVYVNTNESEDKDDEDEVDEEEGDAFYDCVSTNNSFNAIEEDDLKHWHRNFRRMRSTQQNVAYVQSGEDIPEDFLIDTDLFPANEFPRNHVTNQAQNASESDSDVGDQFDIIDVPANININNSSSSGSRAGNTLQNESSIRHNTLSPVEESPGEVEGGLEGKHHQDDEKEPIRGLQAEKLIRVESKGRSNIETNVETTPTPPTNTASIPSVFGHGSGVDHDPSTSSTKLIQLASSTELCEPTERSDDNAFLMTDPKIGDDDDTTNNGNPFNNESTDDNGGIVQKAVRGPLVREETGEYVVGTSSLSASDITGGNFNSGLGIGAHQLADKGGDTTALLSESHLSEETKKKLEELYENQYNWLREKDNTHALCEKRREELLQSNLLHVSARLQQEWTNLLLFRDNYTREESHPLTNVEPDERHCMGCGKPLNVSSFFAHLPFLSQTTCGNCGGGMCSSCDGNKLLLPGSANKVHVCPPCHTRISSASRANICLRAVDNNHNESVYWLVELPVSVWRLKNITQLYLECTGLTELPDAIGELEDLTILNLTNNQLTELPGTIGNIITLEELLVSKNAILDLPDTFRNLANLRELRIAYNQLTRIPKCIQSLTMIEFMDISGNLMLDASTFFEMQNLVHLETLKASNIGMKILPLALWGLLSLKHLDISANKVTKLPITLCCLRSLLTLNLSNNYIHHLPDSIQHLENLKELLLGGNRGLVLPKSIGALWQLEKLDLCACDLFDLPPTLGSLGDLTVLNIEDNRLKTFPRVIAQLTQLEKLFIRGNPFATSSRLIDSNPRMTIKMHMKNENGVEVQQPWKPVEIVIWQAKESTNLSWLFDTLTGPVYLPKLTEHLPHLSTMFGVNMHANEIGRSDLYKASTELLFPTCVRVVDPSVIPVSSHNAMMAPALGSFGADLEEKKWAPGLKTTVVYHRGAVFDGVMQQFCQLRDGPRLHLICVQLPVRAEKDDIIREQTRLLLKELCSSFPQDQFQIVCVKSIYMRDHVAAGKQMVAWNAAQQFLYERRRTITQEFVNLPVSSERTSVSHSVPTSSQSPSSPYGSEIHATLAARLRFWEEQAIDIGRRAVVISRHDCANLWEVLRSRTSQIVENTLAPKVSNECQRITSYIQRLYEQEIPVRSVSNIVTQLRLESFSQRTNHSRLFVSKTRPFRSQSMKKKRRSSSRSNGSGGNFLSSSVDVSLNVSDNATIHKAKRLLNSRRTSSPLATKQKKMKKTKNSKHHSKPSGLSLEQIVEVVSSNHDYDKVDGDDDGGNVVKSTTQNEKRHQSEQLEAKTGEIVVRSEREKKEIKALNTTQTLSTATVTSTTTTQMDVEVAEVVEVVVERMVGDDESIICLNELLSNDSPIPSKGEHDTSPPQPRLNPFNAKDDLDVADLSDHGGEEAWVVVSQTIKQPCNPHLQDSRENANEDDFPSSNLIEVVRMATHLSGVASFLGCSAEDAVFVNTEVLGHVICALSHFQVSWLKFLPKSIPNIRTKTKTVRADLERFSTTGEFKADTLTALLYLYSVYWEDLCQSVEGATGRVSTYIRRRGLAIKSALHAQVSDVCHTLQELRLCAKIPDIPKKLSLKKKEEHWLARQQYLEQRLGEAEKTLSDTIGVNIQECSKDVEEKSVGGGEQTKELNKDANNEPQHVCTVDSSDADNETDNCVVELEDEETQEEKKKEKGEDDASYTSTRKKRTMMKKRKMRKRPENKLSKSREEIQREIQQKRLREIREREEREQRQHKLVKEQMRQHYETNESGVLCFLPRRSGVIPREGSSEWANCVQSAKTMGGRVVRLNFLPASLFSCLVCLCCERYEAMFVWDYGMILRPFPSEKGKSSKQSSYVFVYESFRSGGEDGNDPRKSETKSTSNSSCNSTGGPMEKRHSSGNISNTNLPHSLVILCVTTHGDVVHGNNSMVASLLPVVASLEHLLVTEFEGTIWRTDALCPSCMHQEPSLVDVSVLAKKPFAIPSIPLTSLQGTAMYGTCPSCSFNVPISSMLLNFLQDDDDASVDLQTHRVQQLILGFGNVVVRKIKPLDDTHSKKEKKRGHVEGDGGWEFVDGVESKGDLPLQTPLNAVHTSLSDPNLRKYYDYSSNSNC
eukprot:m.180444 g.180444  ORF g.180444 m.180444 type:complete len:2139 (+) comp13576_c0_seq4:54-6470(+)